MTESKTHPLIPAQPPLFAVFEFDTLSGLAWIATTNEEDARDIIRDRELQDETGIMAIPIPAWAHRFNPGGESGKPAPSDEHAHMVG